MNWKILAQERGKKLTVYLMRYKYVLLVLLVGVALLLFPSTGGTSADSVQTATGVQTDFDLKQMEEKLSETLSQIDGAGRVSVMLTIKTGTRQIVAQDGKSTTKSGETSLTTTTVVVSKGSGQQDTVTLQQIYPQFQGALVVCDGGGDPNVKLKLFEAVSALTGLGTDKISICKGK